MVTNSLFSMNSLYDQNTNFQIFCSLWNNIWRFELWHWCCTLQLHICKYVHSMSNLVLLHLNIISNHCCAETFIILWKSRHFSKQYTFLQCRFPPEKCVITFLYSNWIELASWWFFLICYFIIIKFFLNIFYFLKVKSAIELFTFSLSGLFKNNFFLFWSKVLV